MNRVEFLGKLIELSLVPCIFLITKIPLVVYVISYSNFSFKYLGKIEMHNCLGYDKLQKICVARLPTHISWRLVCRVSNAESG